MTNGPIITPAATSDFIDASDAISPTYLNGPVFAKYRAATNMVIDGLADGATFAVKARFPSTAPSDAFVWLSLDRTISQGFQESIASYIKRLQQWLAVLSYEGHPTGMLLAMLAYVLPTTVTVRTVDNAGNWNTYPIGANPIPLPAPSADRTTYPAGYPPGFVNVPPPTLTPAAGNWRWDTLSQPFGYTTPMWWRLWGIIAADAGKPFPFSAPTATWAPDSGAVTVSVVKDPSVSTVTNLGGAFEVTLVTPFNYPDQSTVLITGIVGTGGMTAAINGIWVVTVIDILHIKLNGSTFVGAYTSGGQVSVAGSIYHGLGGPNTAGTAFNWDDGTCWDWAGTGKAISRSEASAITSISQQWKAANVWVVNMIVSYDPTMFDPTQAFGSAKLPDGTWGTWYKVVSSGTWGSIYEASRPASTTCSLLDGSGENGFGWAGNGRVYL